MSGTGCMVVSVVFGVGVVAAVCECGVWCRCGCGGV